MFGDDDLGKAVYGLLSAFDHGQLWAVRDMVEPIAPDLAEPDVMVGQLVSAPSKRIQAALVAFWPYHRANLAFLDWYGWPAPELRDHLNSTLRVLREQYTTEIEAT